MANPTLWISAIEIGCFFGLLALGFWLILIGSGFFNFAVGPLAMVGGLGTSALVINAGLPVPAAIVIALLIVVLLSALMEIAVVRPIQQRSGGGELPALVVVAALIFATQEGAGLVFGRASLPGQRLSEADPIELGDAVILINQVIMVFVTLMVFILVALMIRYTAIGRLLRAVGDNNEAAGILGLPVRRVRVTAFMLGGLIAGIAGLLYSAKSGVAYNMGLTWTLSGFLALVIGGSGRLWAPLIGGLILGVVQVFAPFYLSIIGPQTIMLVLGLIFFAFKPEGLFVRKVRA